MLKIKGMTLLETLLSSALLLMVSVAVLIVFQATMREYRFKSQVSDTLKSNSIGLNKMTKELMLAQSIYCPTAAAKTALNINSDNIEDGYMPAGNISACLAFNIRTLSRENRVVGYYLDEQTGEIKRAIFDAGANENASTWTIADPSTQITPIAHANSQENFRYSKFTFRFDRAYKNVAGHSPLPPDSHARQILVIGITLKRTVNRGQEANYPISTKIWLERNESILPQ